MEMVIIMKKHLFFIIYGLLLLVSTGLSVLGTFIIPNDLSDADIIGGEEQPTFDEPVSDVVITDNSYKDENIEITITQVRYLETEVYVADIKVSDPKLLQTAFAEDRFGQNIKEHTSKIAQRHNAILAINGDYYGFRLKGYVIRNGVLYDPTREYRDKKSDILVVHDDGSFEIMKEYKTTPTALYEKNAWQVFCFGPGLISNGNIIVDSTSEVGGHKESNPRTAIAIIEPGHYLMVVSDGRTEESAGLSLLQMAEFLEGYGVTDAYNLDGGGSSVMVFNGKVVNKPTTNGVNIRERSISDIVYIGY